VTAGSVAGIDCGTNSTRLLVVDPDGRQLTRVMRITRLGEGVDRHHELGSGAIDRTVATLGEFRTVMADLDVGSARMVATSAVRDAANGQEFLQRAHQATGVLPEVLTGTEEGQLAYRGANSDLPPFDGDSLVVDIGGGSTELTLGRSDAVSSVSLQLGCVRLTERFLEHDPPSAAEVAATRIAIEEELSRGEAEVPELVDLRPARQLIGLAGTVSTLAALKLGVPSYDAGRLHHTVIGLGEVHAMCEQLAGLSANDRGGLVGMAPGREDVILGGALVLEAVAVRYHFSEVITSEKDILDGIVLGLL
jgi:exopolyphosphatase / guanosine-5'-triphosphate,3'-diphosphate pyrophosphatase